VVDYLYADDEAIGPHRVATREDVLAAVRELGGVEREAFHPSDNFGWQRPILVVSVDKPGRYLIVPLDTGDTE
jgi:hypothetical protein